MSLLVYVVGLIGPLTPSESRPRFLELIVFVGCPIGLLLVSFVIARRLVPRLVASVGIVDITGFTGWLLWLYQQAN